LAADPTRRVIIAAAAVLPLVAVSGCGGVDVLASPPAPARDVGVLRAAIAAEQLMIMRYAAVLGDVQNPGQGAAGGGTSATLTAALEPLNVPAGSTSPSPSPSRRAGSAPPVPTAPTAAIAFLRAAEQAAAAAMLDRMRGAAASLAQLFASISASEATHVPVLDDAVRDIAARAGA